LVQAEFRRRYVGLSVCPSLRPLVTTVNSEKNGGVYLDAVWMVGRMDPVPPPREWTNFWRGMGQHSVTYMENALPATRPLPKLLCDFL